MMVVAGFVLAMKGIIEATEAYGALALQECCSELGRGWHALDLPPWRALKCQLVQLCTGLRALQEPAKGLARRQ